MNLLLNAALEYRRLGLSVVPLRANKQSMGSWSQYQVTAMSEAQIREAFSWSSTNALGIICGKISQNLEVIDIDARNDLRPNLYTRFADALQESLPGFLGRLVIARSRNAGFHLYYRCEAAGRNTLLARRPTTDNERLLAPEIKSLVLIETRANSGYIVVYPSPGYSILQGSLSAIPVIQPLERDILFTVARSFNALQKGTPQRKGTLKSIYKPASAPAKRVGSPFWDYDRRGDVIALLEKHHWTVVDPGSDPVRTNLRRPGDTKHRTSGNFHHGLNLLKVFTPNTDFEPERPYRPSSVFAVLECGGDFKAAAKQLILMGYGTPYKKMAA